MHNGQQVTTSFPCLNSSMLCVVKDEVLESRIPREQNNIPVILSAGSLSAALTVASMCCGHDEGAKLVAEKLPK